MHADGRSDMVRSGSIKFAVRKLNDVIKMLEAWFNKWRFIFSIGKCSATLFSQTVESFPPSPIST
jgi:hypothetical protein